MIVGRNLICFYTLIITQEIVKWDKDKELELDGVKVPCKVIKFWGSGVSGKRWFSKDSNLLLKEQGKTQEGKYYLLRCTEEEAKSYSKGNTEHFVSVALQIAAHAARSGKGKLALELARRGGG